MCGSKLKTWFKIEYENLRAAQKYLRYFTAKGAYAKNFYLFQGLSKSKMETRPPPQMRNSTSYINSSSPLITHRTTLHFRHPNGSFVYATFQNLQRPAD